MKNKRTENGRYLFSDIEIVTKNYLMKRKINEQLNFAGETRPKDIAKLHSHVVSFFKKMHTFQNTLSRNATILKSLGPTKLDFCIRGSSNKE